MSLSEVSDPHPSFPTQNPTLTTTFIYIYVIILYKLHSSLNNLQAVQRWCLTPPPFFFFFLEINQVGQKCLSGEQALDLLR